MIQKFFLSNINHLQVGDLAFGHYILMFSIGSSWWFCLADGGVLGHRRCGCERVRAWKICGCGWSSHRLFLLWWRYAHEWKTLFSPCPSLDWFLASWVSYGWCAICDRPKLWWTYFHSLALLIVVPQSHICASLSEQAAISKKELLA